MTPGSGHRRLEPIRELVNSAERYYPWFGLLVVSPRAMDIPTLSSRLGHANSATTLNICAYVLEANDREAADMIGDLLD